MLKRYVEQILNIYNLIDGLMITDKYGYIEYYLTYRPDLIDFRESEIIGKHLFDVYPGLNEKNSSIMRVIQTGKPIFNEEQVLHSFKGQTLHVVNTTMPLVENDAIVGAIDLSRYIDPDYERQNIKISQKDTNNVKKLYTIDDIITNSASMEIMKEKIPMIASTDSSVLIYGETGTGKELIAQSIHTSSKRKSKKFISQNCAAIPTNLLEGILFGTTKGSYTGAEDRPGLFEAANGGTLFLDEINSMELSVQSKILKAIEEKKVTRIGGFDPIKTDIKIITAVNRNPLECVQEETLREDLFYRLSVVQLNVPPLRERKKDLPYLIDYFLSEFNQQMKRDILGIDEEVEDIFKRYLWPGNVRELRNVIEGAFNITDTRFIRKIDLPKYLLQQVEGSIHLLNPDSNKILFHPKGISLENEVDEYEKGLIEQALQAAGSLTEVAELLGISKQSLNYKLKKYSLNKK